MNSNPDKGWLALALAILTLTAFASSPGTAGAQTLDQLNSQLSELEPQLGSRASNQATAGSVISKLDSAEATFATLAENPKVDKAGLLSAYTRLESMLSRMYDTYKQKKDDCIAQPPTGAQCDYDQPEQLSLQALYPLSWLHFQGAVLQANQPEQAKKLLNQAIDGFTESTLVIVDPNLIHENLLGRAYCERELGKYDKSEYDKAVADFEQIMSDGPNTRQYRPAQQGLATTYAAMGKMDEAAKLTGQLAKGATGSQQKGMEMFRLQQLFKAESATNDASKRAAYHKEAVDFMRGKESDKDSWGIVVAAVAQYRARSGRRVRQVGRPVRDLAAGQRALLQETAARLGEICSRGCAQRRTRAAALPHVGLKLERILMTPRYNGLSTSPRRQSERTIGRRFLSDPLAKARSQRRRVPEFPSAMIRKDQSSPAEVTIASRT